MHSVDLIIFDFDGTLVDSRADIVNAVNYAMAKTGLKSRNRDEILAAVGRGVDQLFIRLLRGEKEAVIKKALSVFMEYHKENPVIESAAYPGVKEVLAHFKDKYIAIITNRRYELTVPILKKLGILDYFKEISGGDDPDCLKPNPCPLIRIMRKLGVNDKKNAIIVGDMDLDIYAGKDAGILTCGVTYGIGKKEDLLKAKPDYILDDIRGLKEIIK